MVPRPFQGHVGIAGKSSNLISWESDTIANIVKKKLPML